MEIPRRIAEKTRHGLLTQALLSRLNRIGLRIEPFYLYEEGIFQDFPPKAKRLPVGFTIGLLGPSDMKEIATIPGRFAREEALLSRLKKGDKCFGLKCDGKIAAFLWCDFDNLQRYYQFPLSQGEVYLFDQYTLETFRGRDIAPHLRFECYNELKRHGYDKFYSYSDCFNAPAIRFKQKLNAKRLALGIKITIRKRRSFILTIHTYNKWRMKGII